ncbi:MULTISPECIES: DUF4249 domain-containing protein [unclassified Sphingobacterium]|uniref:DUF4249 domain-containing protein n=1 Tax=unclassified Sphingobacterium TaxID=2609468 RepID=UPI0025D73452|nr:MULTISPECIES: DUF4249 domain-containing protein [unclassified Sphingobacterium]
MKKIFAGMLLAWITFVGCEDKIDLNLPENTGQLVITADLMVSDQQHQISIQKVIGLKESMLSPITDAEVFVRNLQNNRIYTFSPGADGLYTNKTLRLQEKASYQLHVKTADGKEIEGTSTVPTYVDVDSIGLSERIIFTDTIYYPTLVFNDPPDKGNYYKYKMSVNGGELRFIDVFNDKYNNGLQVQHDIIDRDRDLKLGDRVRILRQCIDVGAYNYWNSFQMINPGAASPSNPISNLSNGVLGYFSVSVGKYYESEVILSRTRP